MGGRRTRPRVAGDKVKAGDTALAQEGLHACICLGDGLRQLAIIWGGQGLDISDLPMNEISFSQTAITYLHRTVQGKSVPSCHKNQHSQHY